MTKALVTQLENVSFLMVTKGCVSPSISLFERTDAWSDRAFTIEIFFSNRKKICAKPFSKIRKFFNYRFRANHSNSSSTKKKKSETRTSPQWNTLRTFVHPIFAFLYYSHLRLIKKSKYHFQLNFVHSSTSIDYTQGLIVYK